MILFKRATDLTAFVTSQKLVNKSIGFVPTMGALHQGHLSLLQQSAKQNDTTICSIFVNPTQFNNEDDFIKYPVTIEKDIQLLAEIGCTALFLPDNEEVYPHGHSKKIYDLGELEFILEGKFRPGHFQGVCEVVDRLLTIVQPHQIYLGQKDFQQCIVIKKMIRDEFNNSIKVNTEPTLREEDGLAMSSRNLRLTKEGREKAPAIYGALQYIKQHLGEKEADVVTQAKKILSDAQFSIDYVEIVNPETLMRTASEVEPKVALIAASLESIRLIDNMMLL